ncbi:MAG: hypothetical protein L0228_01200 [Planctomycetes bacterium]|nr:hypothetical protein [Planctomycetota bacterium]
MWCSIATSLAAALLAFGVDAAPPAAESSAGMGEVVDADLPATYRLPPVAAESTPVPAPETTVNDAQRLFLPPLASVDETTPVATQTQTPSAAIPAGSPPDGGLGQASDATDVVHAPTTSAAIVRARPRAAEAADATAKKLVDITPCAATAVESTAQLLPAVQRGFGLAQRGALYAARTEFVQVLRRVAQARDVAADSAEHSRALAAGLRALDEAEDFVPHGVQLEAELDVRAVASSHRTSVLPDGETEDVSPFEAVAMYHSYAQEQLKAAVAGDQAGSMALYGLGTIYARLSERGDDDVQLTRRAMTMHAAALAACPNNHMAANELGVLVCRAGRAEEAARLFKQTINFAPSAVAYHNLAVAQQRLGMHAHAAANEVESQRLAAMERERGDVSRRAGIRWVTPAEMARAAQPNVGMPATANRPVSQPPAKSAWQRVVESTKSLPLPGGRAKENVGPMQDPRVAGRKGATGPKQLQWR